MCSTLTHPASSQGKPKWSFLSLTHPTEWRRAALNLFDKSISHWGVSHFFPIHSRHISPTIANVLFTRKSGHLENANVVAIGVWLKITEVPVGSMFTSLTSHPFLEFICALGVQVIKLLNCGQYRWRFFGCSLNKCIKLLTIPHALAWRMNFDSVHEERSTFFSIANLVHEGRLAVEALGHFLLLRESRSSPSLSFRHDSFLRELVLSSPCSSSWSFRRRWGFRLLLHHQSHAHNCINHRFVVLCLAFIQIVIASTH